LQRQAAVVDVRSAGASELALVSEGDYIAVEYAQVNDPAGGLVGEVHDLGKAA
jgi:hypothetical protein